jgi:DNA-binding response OmpR family regulator
MKILLIEDEPKIAAAIQRGLRSDGYSTEIFTDGESGLAAATGDEYDLMIIDRMLPGIEGVEVVKKIREAKIQTPILILTAKGQVRDRVEGLNAGADDYLVKPFSFEELLARIRALLRRGDVAKTDNIFTAGDLTMDVGRRVVTRNQKPITLTATEFSLLEYMLRNSGQVLSKENLITHVWDFDADILPNTVEAYIGYLRSKIDRPFKKKLIHTVRGFGYKIE